MAISEAKAQLIIRQILSHKIHKVRKQQQALVIQPVTGNGKNHMSNTILAFYEEL